MSCRFSTMINGTSSTFMIQLQNLDFTLGITYQQIIFYEFEDHGETIPVIHDTQSQELALGTGSVIEKDGLFYAFYTAHNGKLHPKEKNYALFVK